MPVGSHSTSVLAAAFLGFMVIAGGTALADPTFVSSNGYDFRGMHNLHIHGTTPDDADVRIASDADFRRFKLLARTNVIMSHGAVYYVHIIKVDMNNDGIWELNTTDSEEHTFQITYDYPQPPDNISSTHTVRIDVTYADLLGATTTRTYLKPVTVFATPRVFVNGFGDTFTQLRDEDCTTKIPVLMVEGFDALNDTFVEDYYRIGWDLINTDLYPNNYEVFILNFKDGGQDLRDNAEVIMYALNKIASLCPNYQIAVMGLSMGGLITRYALAKAESQNFPINTGLFVSFDAPQRWANVNNQLQDWIREQDEGAGDLQAILQSKAAMQMLEYNTYEPAHQSRLELHAELNTLSNNGYPRESYNVAVSNGNFNALYSPDVRGDAVAVIRVWKNNGIKEEHIVVATDTDCGAGSKIDDITTQRFGDVFHDPFAAYRIWYEFSIVLSPMFQPTWSSLALVNYAIDEGTGNITTDESSRFDEILVQGVSQSHSAMTPLSRSKVMTWLSKTSNVVVNYSVADGGATFNSETTTIPILHKAIIAVQPKTITTSDGRLITYQFDQWDDGSKENPRTFVTSHDVVRTAHMKAHLATNSSAASWGSNVRRLSEATDPVGPTIHGVYESGGNVWHIRNRRGAGWEQRGRLSWGGASGASITTQSFGGGDQIQVHVAWMTANPPSFVFLSTAPGIGGWDNGLTWGQPKVFYSGYGRDLTLLDANCAGSGHLEGCWPSLLWADGDPDWYPEGLGVWYRKQPQHSTGGGAHLVPGTEGVVSQPVGAPADCGPLGTQHADHHLAFIRGGKAWVETFRDPAYLELATSPQVIVPAYDVTTPGWTAARPTIVSNGTDVMVAWEETQGTLSRIAFRQRSGVDAWSPTVYLWFHGAHVATKPVLGIDHSRGVLNLLWQCSDHIAHVSRPLSGTAWTSQLDLAGRSPSIVASSASRATAMWTIGAVAPYSMVVPTNDLSDVVPPGAINVQPDIVGPNSIYFNWWATADDDVLPASGPAQRFDFRKSPFAINDEYGWSSAGPVGGTPTPGPFGTIHQLTVADLSPCTVYHFSLRAEDDRPNLAALPPDQQVQTTCGGWGGGGEYGAREVAGRAEGGAMLASGSSISSLGPPLVVETRRLESSGWQVTLRLATEADGLDPAAWAITVEGERPDGGRDSLGEFSPGEGEQVLGLCALRERGRLAVPGFIQVERVMAAVRRDGQDYALAEAEHSRLGSLGAAFVAAGGGVELATGDVINLTYTRSTEVLEDPATWYVLVRRQGTAPPVPFSSGPARGLSLPKSFALHQNRPNPFSGSTAIHFDLPVASRVRLEVFDAQGRLVRTLSDGEYPAGFHSIEWDHRTDRGQALGAGVYLYRIQTGSFRDQKKMVLLAR